MRLLIILMLPLAMAQITEVMYDPPGADNNLEYIEVRTQEPLEGWIIADSDSNDTLAHMSGNCSGYVLIVEEGYQCNCSCYSAGATIGNNLNNGGDTISLYRPDGTLFDTMQYNVSATSGLSLQLCDDWAEAEPTPGRANICTATESNITANLTNATINETPANYSANTTIPLVNASNSTIDYPEPGNHTANITNSTTQKANETTGVAEEACPIMTIATSQDIYGQGEKVSYKITLEPAPDEYGITYWVENMAGEQVKSPYTSTNMNQRSYTPNCRHGQAFVIMAESGCASAEKLIAVRCEAEEAEEVEDYLAIEKVYSARFGDIARVKISASRGDYSSGTVEAYIREEEGLVSQTTKLELAKGASGDFTVPIMMFSACDHAKGTYTLVVEGLGKTRKEAILVKEGKCEIEECEAAEAKPKAALKSFYTLAKKYSKKIKLYANLECENCSVVLSDKNGPVEARHLASQDGRIEFEAEPSEYELMVCTEAMGLDPGIEKPIAKEQNRTLNHTTLQIEPLPKRERSRWRYYLLSALGVLGIGLLLRKL